MKTIEEKAKAYDEIIERAKTMLAAGEVMYGKDNNASQLITDIIPDLRESEDERMVEMAIKAVRSPQAQSCIRSWGVDPDDVITWLEKQKEQKKPTLDNPDLYGDWDKDLLEEIHSWLGHLDGKYTPYTIDDIKLTARHFVEWQKQKEQKPAQSFNQEQFFAKKDSTPFEKELFLSLRAIKETKPSDEEIWLNVKEQLTPVLLSLVHKEQKPAWSEESNEVVLKAVELLNRYGNSLYNESSEKANEVYKVADSLKLLSTQPKPEWSEEEGKLNTCPHYSDGYGCDISPRKKCESCEHRFSWKPTQEQIGMVTRVCNGLHLQNSFEAEGMDILLKQLEKIYWNTPDTEQEEHWKPSEEQMEELYNTFYTHSVNAKSRDALESLYNQLKKL